MGNYWVAGQGGAAGPACISQPKQQSPLPVSTALRSSSPFNATHYQAPRGC